MTPTRTILVVLLCLAANFGVAAARAAELPWQFEYDKALADAKTEKQPVLLDFSAAWCGPCRMMETTTFADAGVQAALKGYILVKVDLDANQPLAAKYAVRAIPTCILLNQFGEKVAANVGYADPGRFLGWLQQNAEDAAATESKGEMSAAAIKAAAAKLDAPEPAQREIGLTFLIEIYLNLGKEPADDTVNDVADAKLASDELRAFGQRHPASAVPYLNDRRLGVRILFSQILAEKLGPDAVFDPWEGSAARATALARVTKQVDPH